MSQNLIIAKIMVIKRQLLHEEIFFGGRKNIEKKKKLLPLVSGEE
jgi:hypothetical protein